MDLNDIEEEVKALRGKAHDLSNRIMLLMERTARLEETAKDINLMKGAIAGALLTALASMAVAFLKGG